MNSSFDRRSLLAIGLAGVVLSGTPRLATAQTITDRERTRWLRDGVSGAKGAKPHASALPETTLRVLDRSDREVSVGIDPTRSVDMSVYFALDSAYLEAAAVDELAWLGRALQTELLGRAFLLAGHTDVTGDYGHNMNLSLARARSVREHLVGAFGIQPDTLYIAGFGPDHLRDPSRPTAAVNRRVEIAAIRNTAR